MSSLRFVRLTEDRQHLVFADSAGGEHTLAASADLLVALRNALAPIAAASNEELRPAQIQARLRAGDTVEELISEFGLDEARVRRFEGPVTQERAYVAERSRSARIRGSQDEKTLAEQIEQLLLDRGQSTESLVWDATRGEETFWTVSITRGGAIARFGFDTSAATVWPLEDVARTLIGQAPTNTPRLVPVPKEEAPVVRNIQSVKPQPTIPVETIAEKPREPVRSYEPEPADLNQEVDDIPELVIPEAKPNKKSKRASVPSWDEILFGGGE